MIEKDYTEMLHKRLADFKKQLSEKECFILDNRIMAENPVTLREIGERFNTSRESVRQIQVKLSRNLTKHLSLATFDRPCEGVVCGDRGAVYYSRCGQSL